MFRFPQNKNQNIDYGDKVRENAAAAVPKIVCFGSDGILEGQTGILKK